MKSEGRNVTIKDTILKRKWIVKRAYYNALFGYIIHLHDNYQPKLSSRFYVLQIHRHRKMLYTSMIRVSTQIITILKYSESP